MSTPVSAPAASSVRTARLLAIGAGLLGFLLAVLAPFLPVRQERAEFSWPQDATGTSVTAPLVSYLPEALHLTVPCRAAAAARPGDLLLATMPANAPSLASKGLSIHRTAAAVEVSGVNRLLYSVPAADLRDAPADCTIRVDADLAGTTVRGPGPTGAPPIEANFGPAVRAQVVGLYSTLGDDARRDALATGAGGTVVVDSRFSTSPTAVKIAALVVGVLATLVALGALHRLDATDGRRHRRRLPARWWRLRGVDVAVIGALVIWYVIGATTSDDGYLLTMARASEPSGYMANYYRWLGVPESPIGWYYSILAAISHVTPNGMVMRLPTLLAGIAMWLLIHKEVVPRLGRAARRDGLAVWTGALVFLAFWLPYDNGLRPEPIIALGAILTWVLVERSIATGRLLPGAVAVVIAAFSIAAGPTGVMCVAALLAGLRPYVRALRARARIVGWAAVLAPLLAAGFAVLYTVFAVQTFAAVREATAVRQAIGPDIEWFHEDMRYIALMVPDAGGSFGRRFPVFLMFALMALTAYIVARHRRVPGLAAGPVVRVLGVTAGSLVLLMLTPTKWTHHFGVFAGIGAVLAIAAIVATGPAVIRSARNRWLVTGLLAFVGAWSLSAVNDWWFVSQYGVPWTSTHPRIAGFGLATWMLGGAALSFVIAGAAHVLAPPPGHRAGAGGRLGAGGRRVQAFIPLRLRSASTPIVLLSVLVVGLQFASFAIAAVERGSAFSLARSNIDTLRGRGCALARDVLLDTDSTASVLRPAAQPGSAAPTGSVLGAVDSARFTPDGVRSQLHIDTSALTGIAATFGENKNIAGPDSGITGGTRTEPGVGGSRVALPYGLDPTTVEVLGTYGSGDVAPATLVSGWYVLPTARGEENPVLAVAAAGHFPPGTVRVEWTTSPAQTAGNVPGPAPSGRPEDAGTRTMSVPMARPDNPAPTPDLPVAGGIAAQDPGPYPTWRDLRVRLADLPADATAVRLVVHDGDLDPGAWVAVTPPRVPDLRPLQDVIGTDDPVLLDWVVAFQFPCQRPFAHRDGVAEQPRWRILPDVRQIEAANAWQDDIGGGPLGWTEQTLAAETVPTFLRHDLGRNWGWVQRLTPRPTADTPASLEVTDVTRSGTWTPGPMRR